MGFDIGGIFKAVTDPGSLVNDLAHQFLPKDLQFLGGVAGAIIDYEAGNPVGALKEGMSAFQDLSQNNLSSSHPGGASGAPSSPWRFEPTPPPLFASQNGTSSSTPSQADTLAARSSAWRGTPGAAPLGAPPAAPPDTRPTSSATPPRPTLSPSISLRHPNPSLTQVLEQPLGTAWRGAPPPTPPRTEPRSPPTDPPSTAASTNTPPSTPTPPSTTPSNTATPSTTPSTESGTTTPSTPPSTLAPSTAASTSSTGSSSSTSSSQSQPITDAAKTFLNQGNDALMNAIRSGNIPAAVSDSPAAMMALQAKMNHISEMNQLMTSMMQALHQMQMSIIQNVRV